MNYIKINGNSFDVNVAISKYNKNFSVRRPYSDLKHIKILLCK